MSYCVNCGVELKESESHCPLCDTRVSNPHKPFNENAERTYPIHKDLMVGENRLMTVLLITLLMMVPSLTCLIVEYVISKTNNWSLYVLCGMSVLWTFTVPPLVLKKHKDVITVVIGTISLSVGLWVTEKVTGNIRWFFPLAFPIIISTATLLLVFIVIMRFVEPGVMKLIAFSMYFIALLIVVIEIVTDLYISSVAQLEWSVIVFIPLVLLATAALVVDRKRNVKDEIKKKFHM